jgi:hypothetical protein
MTATSGQPGSTDPVLDEAWKFKTTMRGVDVIQTVYALLIALGLREVFVALYTIMQQTHVANTENLPIAAALFVNIVLLSVRFFWVPRNFRRLYFVSLYSSHFHGAGLWRGEVSFNIGIILIHGFLHFMLCKQFEYFVFLSTAYDFLSTAAFASYVYIHVTLLTVNGLWIIYTNLREDRFRRPDTVGIFQSKPESRIWYRSNLVFALISVAPLAIFSGCSSNMSQCLAAAYTVTEGLSVLPTSAYSIATLFDLIAASASREFAIAWWAMIFLFINSFFDLFLTSGYYVMLEDFETELVHKPKAGSAR